MEPDSNQAAQQPQPQVAPQPQAAQPDPQGQPQAQEEPQQPQAVEPTQPEPAQPQQEEQTQEPQSVQAPPAEPEPPVEEEPSQQEYVPPQVDISTLPRDEEGNIDPNAYANLIVQQASQAGRDQARAEFAEQEREKKLWAEAEKAHPELSNNPALRDLVKNARFGQFAEQVTSGRKNPVMPTPKAIADNLSKEIQGARAQGVEQAQTNVEVQRGAQLESSSVTSNPSTLNRGQVVSQLGSTYDADEKDRMTDNLLKDMFDRGDLKIGG